MDAFERGGTENATKKIPCLESDRDFSLVTKLTRTFPRRFRLPAKLGDLASRLRRVTVAGQRRICTALHPGADPSKPLGLRHALFN